MKALIFAAGRGERMRPLSDSTAKPLLAAGGKRLVEWQIEALARAGIVEFVINTAHLADQIERTLGDGRALGVRIVYSREGDHAEHALETRGGIVHALPLLGQAPFVAVSGDIVTGFDYERLREPAREIAAGQRDAHLVLVDNPTYHPRGDDMGLRDGSIVFDAPRLTYANIAVFAPRLFAGVAPGKTKLFPWLYAFARAGRVSGELYRGAWFNVGTPQDLAQLDQQLRDAPPSGLAPRAAGS